MPARLVGGAVAIARGLRARQGVAHLALCSLILALAAPLLLPAARGDAPYCCRSGRCCCDSRNDSPSALHLKTKSGDIAYVRGTKSLAPEVGVTDEDLAEISPLRGRLTLRYDDGRLLGVAEGVFSARQDHVDSSLDEETTAGWATAHLSAGYRRGRWSATLGVTNLFDRYYTEHSSYQRDPFRSGIRVAEPGQTVFLNLSARF